MTGNIKAAKACAREVVKEFKKKNIEKKLEGIQKIIIFATDNLALNAKYWNEFKNVVEMN